MQQKQSLSFGQIFNMSFGFLGIQIGFALQGANMSRIFQTLGASESDIPGLWLAAPLTGLLVQPVIGHFSDRTWSRWGRRKPYFFIGAVLSCIALIFMPNSSALWMATGMLCILDASINVSMEPFRALVADKLNSDQNTQGFAMQSILIGGGAMFASYLPNIFHMMGIANTASQGVIPDSVRYAFYFGAFCFMAAIMYTNVTTPEDPPHDMEAFLKEKEESKGIISVFGNIFKCILHMPRTMKQIALVQLFTWFALFAMWSNATSHVFHATDTTSEAYNNGADFLNGCWVVFNLFNVLTGFAIYFFGKGVPKKLVHLVCLLIGGAGLMSIYFVSSPNMLYVSFALIGVAWASILSMPFAIISSAIPAKDTGVYMGLFNMFICIPQIIASLGGLNFLTHTFIGPQAIHGLLLGGILMMVAALTTLFIKEEKAV